MRSATLYSSEPARGWLPWGALTPFLGILIVALPAIAAWRLEFAFGLVSERGDPLGFGGLCALLFFDFALTGAVLLAWVKLVERRPLTTLGLVGERTGRGFLGGLGVGLATSTLVVAAIGLAGGYTAGELLPAWTSPAALLRVAILLAGFAVQSSVEEILFRGWLMSALARKLNLVLAVVLTSTVFMLLHYSPHQAWDLMLGTFLFSLFACAWALRSGHIWGVMGWHTGWNWLIAVGFELPITGIDAHLPALLVQLTPRGQNWLTGGAQGPEGSAWCSLFFAVGSAILFRSTARRGGEVAPAAASSEAPLPETPA